MKAIQHAIDEAKLAYAFRAGTYTMSALQAVLAVEAVYLREADPAGAVSRPARQRHSPNRCGSCRGKRESVGWTDGFSER